MRKPNAIASRTYPSAASPLNAVRGPVRVGASFAAGFSSEQPVIVATVRQSAARYRFM
jgi:hypothetical protein